MQVSEAAEAFFLYARVDRMYAPETQTKIKDCFRSWILPKFGGRQVETLSVMDVLEFRRAMMDRVVPRRLPGLPCAPPKDARHSCTS